jgi:hypothetical protein
MAMTKCPYCPQKFQTHHGLGGHLSGPCGALLKAAKEMAKVGNGQFKSIIEVKTTGSLDGLAANMREMANAHRAKAEELEQMASRIGSLA